MKIRGRVLEPTAILTALLTACIYPTDKGDELRIDVAPIARMIRGDSLRVDARLLGADGTPIPNARFVYSSADNRVAVVTTDGLVIAVNAGTTNITVRAMGTQGTPAAQARVAVSGTVSVDSLRPVVARWGQLLSLYGSGLGPGSDQVVTINDVPLSVESYQPADSLHPERFGVLQVLATLPLETNGSGTNTSVLVVTSRGAAALSTPLTIEPVDIFWPNTITPADLGTITTRSEFPGLTFEPPYYTDWLSFRTATAGDWTINIVNGFGGLTFFPAGGVEAELLQGTSGSVASNYIAYYPGRNSSIGDATLCEGRGVWRSFPWWLSGQAFSSGFPGLGAPITLRNVPAGRHDLMVTFLGPDAIAPNDASLRGGSPTPTPFPNRRANEWAIVVPPPWEPIRAQRYDLVIEPATANVSARDAYEPNDLCEDATSPLLTLGSSAFTDSVVNLTFDGPSDIDWFRVVAQTGGLLQMRAPLDTLGYGLGGEMARSDLDSAVVAGRFSGYDSWCGNGWPEVYLVSYGSDGCEVEGVSLQAGAYHLVVQPEVARPYQMVVTWAPGGLPVAPRTAPGHR